MAEAINAGGLNSWGAVIGSVASSTAGPLEITTGKSGQVGIAIVGTTVTALAESSTTDGLYKVDKSTTTAASAVFLIL